MTSSRIRVLEADPDLGMGLGEQEFGSAALALTAPCLSIAKGPADFDLVERDRRSPLGLLVVEGQLTRDSTLAGNVSSELLGVGDVFEPWSDDGDRLVPVTARWRALTEARVAVLDNRLMAASCSWPEVLRAIIDRGGQRATRLATQQAISQLPRVDLRLLALFWQLAERWGRIGPDGVIVPVALSHGMLGRLVGAQRPTVSLALRDLAASGSVARRADGSWQLDRAAPEVLEATQRTVARSRRRVRTAPPTPAEAFSQELAGRLRRLRTAYELQAERVPSTRQRLAATRARGVEIRRVSATLRDSRV